MCHIPGYFIADYTVFALPACHIVQTLSIDISASCPISNILMVSFSTQNSNGYLWQWNGHAYELRSSWEIYYRNLTDNVLNNNFITQAQQCKFFENSVYVLQCHRNIHKIKVDINDLRYCTKNRLRRNLKDLKCIIDFKQTNQADRLILLEEDGRISVHAVLD